MNTRTMGNSSRLVGRLLLFVWAALFVSVLGARATPVQTLVKDTLYRADGSAAQGDVTIRWNGFSTSVGEAVAAGQMTVTTDANGGISIPLIANTGSSPAGSYYRVVIKLDDGTTSEETWVVPAATTTTVAAIRAKMVPQAVAAQFVGRDYMDSALATMVKDSTTINGFPISSNVTLSVSNLTSGVLPNGTTATTQSASDDSTKVATTRYVDQMWATPPAIGSTAPGVVNATEFLVNGIPLASANLGDGVTLARNTAPNAFTANQRINYSGADGTNPLLVNAAGSAISGAAAVRIVMPVAGAQNALAVGNASDANSWFSLNNNANGFVGSSSSSGANPSQPGFEFGAGGAGSHDTFLYRSSAGTLSTPGALGVGAAMAAQSVNGEPNEQLFIGSTLAARILAACTPLAGANGVVLIPSTETSTDSGFGPFATANGALPEGCTVRDLRGVVYPNYGGYGVSSGAPQARSILYWQQRNTAPIVCCSDPTMMQLHYEPNAGGQNSYHVQGTITSVTVDGANHVTLGTTYSLWVPGLSVLTGCSGTCGTNQVNLTNATFLNGQTLTITSQTPYSITATLQTAHAAYATTGDSGTATVTAGTKTNYQNLYLTQNARTPGQHIGLSSQLNNYSNGDAAPEMWQVNCYGMMTAPGDEGCEGLSANVTAGFPALTATVASVSGNTLTMTCGTNCGQLGEQQVLVNTSRNTYGTAATNGNGSTVVSISGSLPVVIGAGTTWSSLCPGGTVPCNPTNLWFEMTGETYNNVHITIPVQTISSDTSLTLGLINVGLYPQTYRGLVTSGAYTIYHGSTITAVPYTGGVYSTIQATVADPTQFQAGDGIMQPGGPLEQVRGLHIGTYQNVPYPSNAGGAILDLNSGGHFPMYSGIVANGQFSSSIWTSVIAGTAPTYGFRLQGPTISGGWFYVNDPLNNNLEQLLCTLDSLGAAGCLGYDRTSGNNRFQLKNLYATGLINAAGGLQANGLNVVTQDAGGDIAQPGNIVAGGAIAGAAGGIGPYQNLIPYSQFDAGNGAWGASSYGAGTPPTFTANTTDVTDPYGGNTAEKAVIGAPIGSSGGQSQTPTLTNGLPYTESLWARGAIGGETLQIYMNAGVNVNCKGGVNTLTTSWVRYQFTCTPGSGDTHAATWLSYYSPGATIYVWGAQLEQASSAGIYVHTAAASIPLTQGLVVGGAPVTAGGVASVTASLPLVASTTSGAVALTCPTCATTGNQVVISQSSDVANTGFTTQQTLCSLKIPANTTSGTQDAPLSRWTGHATVSTSGSGNMVITHGMAASSSSLGAGNVGSSVSIAAGRAYSLDITCHNRSASSQICEGKLVHPTNNIVAMATTFSLSTASDMYYVIQGTQTVSGDTTTCRMMEATIK